MATDVATETNISKAEIDLLHVLTNVIENVTNGGGSRHDLANAISELRSISNNLLKRVKE